MQGALGVGPCLHPAIGLPKPPVPAASAPAQLPIPKSGNANSSARSQEIPGSEAVASSDPYLGPDDQSVDSLMAGFRNDFNSQINNLKLEINSHTVSTIGKLIRAYDKNTVKRHERNEAQLLHLDTQDKAKDRKIAAHDSRLEAIEARLGMAASVSNTAQAAAFVGDIPWSGPANPTLLRGNVHEGALCSTHSVKLLCEMWLAETGLVAGKNFQISSIGEALSASWAFSFTGEIAHASIAAQRALKAMRNRSNWHEYYVVPPSGESARFYIGPDKTPQQIATERAGKKLLAAFKHIHPELPVTLQKNTGILRLGWDKLAKVKAIQGKYIPEIWWHHLNVQKHVLNKVRIDAHFKVLVDSQADEGQWSL
jgi:hypothetical protein